jgi:hypothetical protein
MENLAASLNGLTMSEPLSSIFPDTISLLQDSTELTPDHQEETLRMMIETPDRVTSFLEDELKIQPNISQMIFSSISESYFFSLHL